MSDQQKIDLFADVSKPLGWSVAAQNKMDHVAGIDRKHDYIAGMADTLDILGTPVPIAEFRDEWLALHSELAKCKADSQSKWKKGSETLDQYLDRKYGARERIIDIEARMRVLERQLYLR